MRLLLIPLILINGYRNVPQLLTNVLRKTKFVACLFCLGEVTVEQWLLYSQQVRVELGQEDIPGAALEEPLYAQIHVEQAFKLRSPYFYVHAHITAIKTYPFISIYGT